VGIGKRAELFAGRVAHRVQRADDYKFMHLNKVSDLRSGGPWRKLGAGFDDATRRLVTATQTIYFDRHSCHDESQAR
jgi:hypothetical protein